MAVAEGAILKVLGIGSEPTKKVHFCPRFYGVRLNQAYEEWKNYGMSTQQNRFTGREIVNDQIVWLVQKDDVIQPGSSIKKTIEFQGQMETVQHRRGINLRVSFVATAQLMVGKVVPSNMTELKQGKSPALTLCWGVLTMMIVRGESFEMLVNLSAIPRNELREQRQAKGWGKYLVADFVGELEVNERQVSFTVKRWSSGRRDYVVEAKHTTAL